MTPEERRKARMARIKARAAKGKEQLALVYKKKLDFSGALWVDVKVDPSYYEGEAMNDMCRTVLAACIIMIEILREHDKQFAKVEQEKRKLQQKAKTMQ